MTTILINRSMISLCTKYKNLLELDQKTQLYVINKQKCKAKWLENVEMKSINNCLLIKENPKARWG